MARTETCNWYRTQLHRLGERLERTTETARKPSHLAMHRVCMEIRAARLTVEAVNAGYFDPIPSIRRDLRLFWSGELSGTRGRLTVEPGPNGPKWRLDIQVETLDDDDPLPVEKCTDNDLARLWVLPIVELAKSLLRNRFDGFAGSFNVKRIKTNEQGIPLTKLGRPWKLVKSERLNEKTGKSIPFWHREGEPAYVGDDFDEDDLMAHEMRRASDSASACRALADAVEMTWSTLDDWNALSDRQRNCMQALRELKAFDADSRKRAEEIAIRAEGPAANVNGFKEPLSRMVRRSLVESNIGREGGYWLTGCGRRLLNAVDSSKSLKTPHSK